jgi:hypothetical protein
VDSGVYNVVDDEPLRFREYVEVAGAGLDVTQRLRLPVWLGLIDEIEVFAVAKAPIPRQRVER